MRELFEINLLTNIQELDKKFSISRDRPQLTKKQTTVSRDKDSHFNDRKKEKKTVIKDINKNTPEGYEDNPVKIDITI